MTRIAPPAVYEIAPGLGQFTDEVLFGEVWERGELKPRDRSLITVAALVSSGKIAQVGGHVGRALDNGVKREEIGELITHMAFYSGWPNAVSAVEETRKVFEQRKVGSKAQGSLASLELEAGAEAARRQAVESSVGPVSPILADLTNRVLFGQVWRRPELSARDRSLITMAALIALGQPEQLPFHANRAMDNGLTRAEMAEIPGHLAFYAGWPRAMSAVPVLEKVFVGRQASAPSGLVITRKGDSDKAVPEEYFTGKVRVSAPYQGQAPARVSGATVSFPAGARTAWHTHPLGQTLFIVSGKAWIQKEGEAVQEAGPGDVVWIPPLTRHWHGASATEPMVHFAVAEALDGKVVTWMEKVSEDDYNRGPRR